MLHQSEAYYERCHAADLDPARSTEDRLRCWTAWVEHYRVGMPPERVSHARRRLAALNDGIALDPLPDVTPSYTATFMALEAESDARVEDGVQDAGVAVADAPSNRDASAASATNASAATDASVAPNPDPSGASTTAEEPPTASPRATAPGRDPSRIPPRPRPLAPRAASPTHPCTPVCQPRWDACVDRATARGIDGLEACRIEHRVCMNGCM